MDNNKKSYQGSIKDERMAARLYDKLNLKNQGLQAKTNFDYTKNELVTIVGELWENFKLERY